MLTSIVGFRIRMVHIKVGWSKDLVWDLREPKLERLLNKVKFIVNFELLDALEVLRFLLKGTVAPDLIGLKVVWLNRL
jgi:hypothetical protein